MTINEIQDSVIDEFSAFDDWMDKYALLIDLGNSLPVWMKNIRRKAI